MKLRRNTLLLTLKSLISAAILTAASVYAQDAKPDPTGVWTWTAPGRNGGPDRTNTLTLKIEDSKLTGKLAAPGRRGRVNEASITEGKVDGDNIAFLVVREFNGNSITNKYSGKIEAGKIHGKIQFTRDGEEQSRDWEASRSTDAK
jgi:hypothetical protein